MARIRSLRPNVSREEATDYFSSGLADILRTTVSGPLKSVVYIETPNHSEPLLDEAEATKIVIAKVHRLLFSTGFFRVRNLRISAKPVAGEIYVPYWVGFRGRGVRARFVVMDAVRRKMEGAKVRHLLQAWLTSIR